MKPTRTSANNGCRRPGRWRVSSPTRATARDARGERDRKPPLGRDVAELREVLALLLVARRKLEQPGRGAAQDVVLGLLRDEFEIEDRARQVEVPVRIVGRIEQLGLRVDHAERA